MPKNMRHVVSVMRPTEAQGTRGQIQGTPETIIDKWPCSIETLNGREVVQARTVFAEATHRVEGYGNPAKRFKERDYVTGGSIGERVLAIGFINDKQQNGVELSLLCGERTGG
jgi:head-tail adaptor